MPVQKVSVLQRVDCTFIHSRGSLENLDQLNWAKSIPDQNGSKTLPLWGGTYLYGLHKGVPPGGEGVLIHFRRFLNVKQGYRYFLGFTFRLYSRRSFTIFFISKPQLSLISLDDF